jgi:hypothetical protein
MQSIGSKTAFLERQLAIREETAQAVRDCSHICAADAEIRERLATMRRTRDA